MDDNYSTDFDEFDPGGFDDAGFEGDGSHGLPEGHWATDREWLSFMDQFAAQLHADEALLEKFNEFLGTMGGEHGEHEQPASEQPAGHASQASRPGQWDAAQFSKLTDPALREHVLGLFRQERESKRG